MVPLDRALVSSYRLSIVTMPLAEAIWPQFAMQYLGCSQYPCLGGMGDCRGSKFVPHGSGRATVFVSSDSQFFW